MTSHPLSGGRNPFQLRDRIRTWLVDDEPDYCRLLARGLNRSKFVQCDQTFCDCKALLTALRHESSPPQVILLDIQMPVLSGLDAIRPILKISPCVKIVMLTGYADKQKIRDALKAGALGYLLKTSSLDEINRGLVALMGGGAPVDPMIVKKILELSDLGPAAEYGYSFTQREREIVELLLQGRDRDEIAERLCVSFHTIDTHFKNIFDKCNVHSTRELMAKVMKARLL